MPRTRRTFSQQTTDAATVLGQQVAQARRERRLTQEELAERAGVTPFTVSKVERGDPTVALGTAFEVARLVGVPLFGVDDRATMDGLARQGRDRLTLLPARVRPSATMRCERGSSSGECCASVNSRDASATSGEILSISSGCHGSASRRTARPTGVSSS